MGNGDYIETTDEEIAAGIRDSIFHPIMMVLGFPWYFIADQVLKGGCLAAICVMLAFAQACIVGLFLLGFIAELFL